MALPSVFPHALIVQNALRSESNTALCKVSTAKDSYIVRCCVKGSLLEVNERLINQPELLNSSSHKPSSAPDKCRECLPLVLIMRNMLKYALTYRETSCKAQSKWGLVFRYLLRGKVWFCVVEARCSRRSFRGRL
ncbi:hypothetical protein CARUB_v10018175mg [Capsella rubella]|uniref:Uncharacterized protein n=1 Tax=Capsella rubella TaxID=81985 RepID=R0FRQ5_9BRAS|nr:hypothetical protein CARUB_v10018175mg [Capsella rubella]